MVEDDVDRGEPNFRALAEFRYALRKFQAFSEVAASGEGLTSQQHQALLAIKGFGGDAGLSVGKLAERLLVRHNTAAELVNRLESVDLARRVVRAEDARVAHVVLTARGQLKLRKLAETHVAELQMAQPGLRSLLRLLGRLPRISKR
jgi:DNA-binding MarR family transcriptional regulator